MIFRLLIVDDEATMRKGISNFMNWASIDCQVAGTASDGAEAIEFLRTHPVDIVITDIKMPVADGLEIARYVYENHMEIKIILLTGYADFTYAQTAIQYNVSSFILKPTNKKALFEAVQEAQKELIVSRQNSSMAKEGKAFLKEQLLQELTISPNPSDIDILLEELDLRLTDYFIAAFQMIPFDESITALKNIIIDEKQNAYCYRYNNLILTIYYVDTPASAVPDSILNNCREIIRISNSLSDENTAAGISRFHASPSEFGTAVSEAIHALTLNFYTEENIAVFSDSSDESGYDMTAENSMALFQFENAMNNWDFLEAENILSNIFMRFKSNLVSSTDAKNICSQIYYICSRVLLNRGQQQPDSGILCTILSSSDIFSLESTSFTLFSSVKNHLTETTNAQNKLIYSAQKYIRDHLASPLSLEVLAAQLHVSPSHLSRTFKKICRESITEYINTARIEKAKELLSTQDLLSYEVAQLIGYNDPTYFSSIFKKYTGVSPTEFRQQNRS